MYHQLLRAIELGPTKIRNRIFNPPHGTSLGHGGIVSEDLIAYHQTRARGGVGLIILEGMTLHPSYGFEEAFLYAGNDRIIPGMHNLVKACGEYDTPVFGQLFHAGRAVRLSHDGSRPLTYSASDVPDERYRVVPVPMPNDMVWEMIDSYVNAAGRLAEAGLAGVEILASMGYLISQFLNPHTNQREDEFGGSFENRLRFLREIINRTRKKIGDDCTLGIRITLDEKTENGLDADTMIKICTTLEQDNHLDYFSVIAGSSAAADGWIHVFPPMAIPHAYVADDAARLKQAVSKPVLVAGRINQPQTAEAVLAEGKADMVGMVRALITDPEFVNKLADGRGDDIRACIGCNQACVGHRLAHHVISCIQNPITGRERQFVNNAKAMRSKTVLVVGAGSAGMKAAVTAAQRDHQVHLYEKTNKLGGQVNLAERLPGRAEFGGVTTNLMRELELQQVTVNLNTSITDAIIEQIKPDAIVLATGSHPRLPDVEIEDAEVFDAWSVIRGDHQVGKNVVIADWSCDWNGLGVAQMLAQQGRYVRLLSGGSIAGESIQGIVRDHWLGELHKLKVELTPLARFYGLQGNTAFFQHMTSGEAIICENVDTLVSCFAPQSNRDCDWITDTYPDIEVCTIGDAMSPRTVEEAVLEGFKTAWEL